MILFKRKKGTPIPSDALGVGLPIVNLNTGELYIKTSSSKMTNVCENEANIARSAESTLNSRVNVVISDLTAEVTRAKVAEQNNTTAISDEEIRAIEAEEILGDNINKVAEDLTAEVTRADTAEKANANAIAAEVQRAKAAESDLNTGLASANNNINNLFSIAHTHIYKSELDKILPGDVSDWNNEVGAKTAVVNEKTRAESVENGLNTRLTTAEGEIDAIEEDISKIRSGSIVVNKAQYLQNITFHI